MVARCWRVLGCHLLRSAIIGLLVLSVIGLPIAARSHRLAVHPAGDLLRGCVDQGRPPAQHGGGARPPRRTARVTGSSFLVSVVVGPALSVGLIFADLSPEVINLIGSVLFAVIAPYVTLGRTLFFLDLEAHPAEASARRRWA